jgi:hypothetical protein
MRVHGGTTYASKEPENRNYPTIRFPDGGVVGICQAREKKRNFFDESGSRFIRIGNRSRFFA